MSAISPAEATSNAGPKSRIKTNKRVAGMVLVVLGLVIGLAGIICGTAIPPMINSTLITPATKCKAADLLKEEFITPHGDCTNCVPVYTAYHPFRVDNALEYLAAAENDRPIKLSVTEMGPYTYRQNSTKINVAFNQEGTTLTYQKKNTWTYEPSMSCSLCKETDTLVTLNAAYLAIMTPSQGEKLFITTFLAGFYATTNITRPEGMEINSTLLESQGKPSFNMMVLKGLNGIGSMDAQVTLNVLNRLGPVLGSNQTTFEAAYVNYMLFANPSYLGIEYTGLFVTRSVRDLAVGSSSYLAGFVTVSMGLSACGALMEQRMKGTIPDVLEMCATCNPLALTSECLADMSDCQACGKAAGVMMMTETVLCPKLKAQFEVATGSAETAALLAASTCETCATNPLFCLAPLPGHLESSGFDWTDPAASALLDAQPSLLKTIEEYTGCDGKPGHELGENTDVTPKAIWKAGLKTNPTSLDFYNFEYNCANAEAQDPKVTLCEPVSGSSLPHIPPAGATINGLSKDMTTDVINFYSSLLGRVLKIVWTGKTVTVHGIALVRYELIPPMAISSMEDQNMGIGVPHKGVINLSFASEAGFLTYFSAPFFLMGDDSLVTSGINLYTSNQQLVMASTFQDEFGTATSDALAAYRTYIDIEPATGKAMRGLSRGMLSYAIGKTWTGEAVTDYLNKNVPTEIIIPVMWMSQEAIIPALRAETFVYWHSIASAILPLFVTGLVLGILLLVTGAFYLQRDTRRVTPN